MIDFNCIFEITTSSEFDSMALALFAFQYQNNSVYREFCTYLGKNPANVAHTFEIPFLPIDFFKSKTIISGNRLPDITFTSSGTTGSYTSKHYVIDAQVYQKSYLKGFEYFFGAIQDYCILALLPSYLERQGSSLIYMVDDLIKKSDHPESGFYLDDTKNLIQTLQALDTSDTNILLLGVSFALLDLAENHTLALDHTIVMETGGMKGRRKEMIREELHQILIRRTKNSFRIWYDRTFISSLL